MNDLMISIACFLATLALYFANKKLYRRHRSLLLMPLVLTPMVLVLLLVVTHISYQDYIGETHWLLWLLGPATIAFAVPVYENLSIIRRHWLSLSAGVITAVTVAVGDLLFLRLSVRSGLAKGAGLGASSHGAGTAKAYEMGSQEGVVSSLVMMLAGIITVIGAPLIGHLLW